MKKPQSVATGFPAQTPAKPRELPPYVGNTPLEKYEELAKELDFMPAQLLEEQLLRFMAEEKIPVYSERDVHAYLKHEAAKQEKCYIWRPLRERDKPKGWDMRSDDGFGKENPYTRGNGSYKDEWAYRPYDRAVPLHILRRVKKIQDRFPNVLFFVNDYISPDSSSFIMVTALDVKRIIFGTWDRPAFDEDNIA